MMQQQQKHPPRTATGSMSSLAAAAAASRQTSVRPSSPVVPTCSFFAKGQCRRGNACRFRHELPSPDSNNQKKRTSTHATKRDDAPMCSFYARGDCRRGEACAFRHEEEEQPVAAVVRSNGTSSSSTPKETTKRRSSKSGTQQHGPEKRWFYGETGWYYGTCHPQPGEWQEHGTSSRSSIAAATSNKSTTTKKKKPMSSLAAAAAAGKKQENTAASERKPSFTSTSSRRTASSPKTIPTMQSSSKGSFTTSRNGRAPPKTAMSNATIGKRPSTSSLVSNSRGSPTTTMATMSVSPKFRDLPQKTGPSSGAETTTKNMTQSECESTISSVQRSKVPLQPLAVRTDENKSENDVQRTNVSPTDSKSTSNSTSETNVGPSAPHSNETVFQENSKDAETRSTGKDKTLLQKEEEDIVIKMRTSKESKTQDSNSAAQTSVSSNGNKDGTLTTKTAAHETSKHAHKENTNLNEDPVMEMRTSTSPATKTKKMGILPSFSKLKIDTSELVTDSKDLSISRTSTMTEEEEDVSPLAAATGSSPSSNFNFIKETFEGKKVSAAKTPPTTTTPRSSRHPAFAPKKSTLTPPAASPSSLARAAAASKQTHSPTAKKSSSNLSDSKDLGISRTSTMTEEEEDVSPLAATTERRSPSNNFNFSKGTFEGKKVSAAKPPPLHSTTTTPRSSRHPAFAPKKSTLTPPAAASAGPSSLARAAAAAGKQTHTPTAAKKSSSNNHNTVPYWERLYQDGVKHNKERMILQSESFDKECTFTPDLRLSTPRSSMDGSSRHRRKSRNDANGSSIGKNSQRGRNRKSGGAAVPRVIGGPGTTEGKGKSGINEIDENSVLSENSHRRDGRRQAAGSTRWRPSSPSLSTANSRGGERRSLPNQKPQKSKGSPSSLAARASAGQNSVKASKGTSPTTSKGGRPFPNNRRSKADDAAIRAPRGPSPKSTGSAIHKTAGTSTRPKLVSPSDLNAKEPNGDIYGKRSVKSLAARFEGTSGRVSSPNAVPSWGKGGSSGTPRGNDGKGESHGGIKKVWTKEKISPLRHRWGSDSDSD